MRRSQPTTPFDAEADEMTQQFWGASKGWVSAEQPTVRRRAESPTSRRDDTTGSLRVIRDGFAAFRPQTSANATGEIRRQRQHGAQRHSTIESELQDRREPTLGELAAGRSHAGDRLDEPFDDDYLDDDYLDMRDRTRPEPRELEAEYDVPLTLMQPLVERLGLGAVDPLLVRAGVFVLARILLVPVMLSMRPDRDDSLPGDVVEAPQPVVAGAAPAPADAQPTRSSASSAPAESSAAVPTSAPATAPSTEPTQRSTSVVTEAAVTEPAPPSTAGDPPQGESTVDLDAATVDVVAERLVPACPQTYTAAPGDSWYRIADEAGVTPSQLLAENNATTETVILPGDDICLPEGAAMPNPPTTVTPPTTEPATTAPAPTATEATSTTAPSTTAPTTTAAPIANMSRSEVQELIRQTWPDDEVENALAVAKRESNFIATADNGWCCVGVFQINWTAHRGWLDDFGINERSDLFDARKNVAAAYHMWQQSGWGPWGG
jgi:LysM repeat protein